MSESTFFSIVVPTYNRASLIGATLRSLCAIDYPSFEIIVVDDGSTDLTREVVLGLGDPRISYHPKSNAERGAARNYGANKARGQYINFFDSDDLAYPNHLAVAAGTIKKLNQPEVFALGYDIRDPEGNLIRVADRFPDTINDDLIDGNHLSANGVFLRADICRNHPFSENRALSASEDYALWMKLAARYPLHMVNVVTSTVVNHEMRSVLTIDESRFRDRMRLLRQEVEQDDAVKKRYGSQWGKFRAYQKIYMALHLALAGYGFSKSLNLLLSAAADSPDSVFSRRFIAALKHALLTRSRN